MKTPPLRGALASSEATAQQPAGGRGGVSDHLLYPKGLSGSERAGAQRQLRALPAELAQQLLDELAGRMEADAIRFTPLAYLRGLVKQACSGAFTPELAPSVAERRKRRRRVEAALRQSEAAHVRQAEERVISSDDNPLVRRILDISKRTRRNRQ